MGAFHGSTKAKIEPNGRLSLPKMFFDEIETNERDVLFMTVERDKCIIVYPRSGWEKRIVELSEKHYEDDDIILRRVRLMERQLRRVKLDKLGRFYLPGDLKAKVGIDKEVEIIGTGSRFDIWSPEELDKYEAQNPLVKSD